MKIFINIYYNYNYLLMIFFSFLILIFLMNLNNLHPLILGLIMLIYSISISLNMIIFSKSSFYSFVMFMVVIGGFLILFMYFNSFAINNKINIELISIKYIFFKLMMILIIYLLMIDQFSLLLCINDSLMEMNLFQDLVKFDFNLNDEILFIYNKFFYLSLFMIVYLFYSMIIVIKMIFLTNPKTLRQMLI